MRKISWYSANLVLRKAYWDMLQFGLYSRRHVQDRLKSGLFKGKRMHVRTGYKPDSKRGSVLGIG